MTLVVAHRGASRQAPENTMEAFKLGVKAGADAIELDVHLTADGELAVIHDDTLDRTTDSTGTVVGKTMDEIRRADAGARFSRDDDAGLPFAGRGLGVPTLPEVLAWLPAKVGLVVEIKARAAADAVVQALASHAARTDGRVAVISFDEPTIERVRELDRELRTGYLLVPGQAIEPAMTWVAERGHTGVLPWDGDLGIDPLSVVAQTRQLGLELGCYVVNDPDRMRFLAACGLWGFVTDVPDVAREALAGDPA